MSVENSTKSKLQGDNQSVGSVDANNAKSVDPRFRWYVAKTMTGQENKVAKALKEKILNLSMMEYFADILVPEESVVSNINGKKRTYKRKFFPGYVLIRMIMTDETWHLVKNSDKITGFLGGSADRPSSISEEEARYMLNQAEEGHTKPKTAINITEGDSVRVIEGPFTTFTGSVESVTEKGKIKVNILIFGRPTPVELDFTQVEKLS